MKVAAWLVGVSVLGMVAVSAAGGSYVEVALDGVYTETHDTLDNGVRGLFDYYTSSPVTRNGIPFRVKTSGVNTVSTRTAGPQDITIPVDLENVIKVHMLGVGTYLATGLGHETLWCADPGHFSLDVHYADATAESLFPTDTVTGLPRWSDILYGSMYSGEGEVDVFPASPWGHVHQYYIDTDPAKPISHIILRDKFAGNADYTILAMTAEVPEPASMAILALGGMGMLMRRRGVRR